MKYASPCSAFALSFIGSFFMGACSPCFGFLIVKNLVGVGTAEYLGTSGLDEI